MKEFSFVIVAGGKGSRMGNEKKQFSLLDNKPVWQWSADKAIELDEIREIILVVPSDYDEKILCDYNVKIIHGGSERAESVLNGLKAATCEYVLVHDAARPFASKDLFLSIMNKVNENVGVVPVLKVSDALKKIDSENKISCVEREGLYITQTPQGFHREKLISAVTNNLKAKDEAEAWEKAGHELDYVNGEKLNFKITFKEDMLIAKSLINSKITRTGLGYDVHKLIPRRKLILGGIKIDSDLGLLGHSDADVLTHSIMDSILGAAGLDDIGNIFPASDEKFKDADSIKLLENVMNLVKDKGFNVEFVDAVVEAQVPRLNKYRDEIKSNLSRFFDINIKFKSPEEIDDTGRGLAMKCWACANLTSLSLHDISPYKGETQPSLVREGEPFTVEGSDDKKC